MPRVTFRSAPLLALVTALACAGPAGPPPLVVPTLTLELDHYQGTPLTGPILGRYDRVDYPSQVSDAPADESLELRFEVSAVAGLEDPGLEPLAAVSKLLAQPLTAQPLRATLTLTLGAWAGTRTPGVPVRDEAFVDTRRTALDPGMTAVLTVADSADPLDTVELAVHRRPDGEPVVVHLVHRVRDEMGGKERVWQQVMIEPEPQLGGAPLVVAWPLDDRSGVLMVEVSVATPAMGDPAHADAVALARDQAGAHRRRLEALALAIASGVPDRTGLITVFEGLAVPENRRGALLYLAGISGADLTGDVALLGNDELIERICDRARDTIAPDTVPSVEEAGWRLEQASLIELVGLVRDGDMPALEAMLLRFAGEVGRSEALLLGLMEESTNVGELAARVLEENILFLDDNAPASRVRAFDWLILAGDAPAGYDPFAPRAQRRAVLDAWRQERLARAREGGA